jgi:hypothetical protein
MIFIFVSFLRPWRETRFLCGLIAGHRYCFGIFRISEKKSLFFYKHWFSNAYCLLFLLCAVMRACVSVLAGFIFAHVPPVIRPAQEAVPPAVSPQPHSPLAGRPADCPWASVLLPVSS